MESTCDLHEKKYYIHTYIHTYKRTHPFSSLKFGSTAITDARKPVPILDGQVPRNPSFSFHMIFVLCCLAALSTTSDSAQNRLNTEKTSPPVQKKSKLALSEKFAVVYMYVYYVFYVWVCIFIYV